ncbi:MAG: 4Fe-4S dicluster domain-containing protein [Bacillota bacterium]
MKTISKAKITELLDATSAGSLVYAPVDEEGTTRFGQWGKGAKLALDAANTVLPPKDLFFPQTEKMYRYKTSGMDASIEAQPPADARRVIFGMRPCDMRSIILLDDAFLTRGFVDQFYKEKRDNTTIVSLGCTKPAPTCFCSSLGINPGAAEGADVLVYDLGETYGFEAKTAKGEEFLQAVGSQLTDTNGTALPAVPECALKVDTEGLAGKLAGMFEHPYWAEACRKCLGCGVCTYVCPTCYCFDIQSENRGDDGFKFRCWDSCMFSEYTRMAGGHNPRPSKKERVRNRFLHKLQYFPERYGKTACIGCGRCLRKCPVNVDITRIVRDLQEVSVNVQ